MSEDKIKNEDLVFSIGDIVAGYKITEKIDEGGFGQVFKVSKDDNIYAMKIENSHQEGGSAIKLEMDVLFDLKSRKVSNFPMMYDGGRRSKFQFLVMELLGDNIKTLRFKSPNPMALSPGTWSRIGIQCLYVVKLLHDNGFVHRDIKPSNFAMGHSSDALKGRTVYLFDFGLARRFVMRLKNNEDPKDTTIEKKTESSRDKKSARGEKKKKVSKRKNLTKEATEDGDPKMDQLSRDSRIPDGPLQQFYRFRIARPHTDFRGTMYYASPNAHLQIELGRHDDVWSLMFMIAEMTTLLPWSTDETIPIEEQKAQTRFAVLFKNEAFAKLDEHLRNCNYYAPPDYEMIHQLLKDIMDKAGSNWNDPYDWETDSTPGYVKWKEEKTKKSLSHPWENAKEFFKKDIWSQLPRPVSQEHINNNSNENTKKRNVDTQNTTLKSFMKKKRSEGTIDDISCTAGEEISTVPEEATNSKRKHKEEATTTFVPAGIKKNVSTMGTVPGFGPEDARKCRKSGRKKTKSSKTATSTGLVRLMKSIVKVGKPADKKEHPKNPP